MFGKMRKTRVFSTDETENSLITKINKIRKLHAHRALSLLDYTSMLHFGVSDVSGDCLELFGFVLECTRYFWNTWRLLLIRSGFSHKRSRKITDNWLVTRICWLLYETTKIFKKMLYIIWNVNEEMHALDWFHFHKQN